MCTNKQTNIHTERRYIHTYTDITDNSCKKICRSILKDMLNMLQMVVINMSVYQTLPPKTLHLFPFFFIYYFLNIFFLGVDKHHTNYNFAIDVN